MVAVSAWKEALAYSGDHVVTVRLFEGSGAMWTAVRVVGGGFGGPGSADGQLHRPRGLRFSGDGTGLAVAEYVNNRVSVFRVEDGSFARHVATGLEYPWDVEECDGGWLVACFGSNTIEFVGSDVGAGGVGRARLGVGTGSSVSPQPWPWCLAWAWWCGRDATVARVAANEGARPRRVRAKAGGSV